MREIYTSSDGRLLPESGWRSEVSALQERVSLQSGISDEAEAVSILKQAIPEAVEKRIPAAPFGVLFSGGVDSSLIAFLCRNFSPHFRCYSVGFGSSKDLAAAGEASRSLGLDLAARNYALEEVGAIVSEVSRIIPKVDVVNVGVASVVYAACRLAKQDGVSVLFSGLGSEEIFAGYQRHGFAADINAECWQGLYGMHQRDLVRDAAIASNLGVSFATPFMEPGLIVSAMRMDGGLKIKAGSKKHVLRLAAAQLGLPGAISGRKKLAAQYGSGFDFAIKKIAKKSGFSSRHEFIQSAV